MGFDTQFLRPGSNRFRVLVVGPKACQERVLPTRRRIRVEFQKTLARELRNSEHYDAHHRMRHKLQRWHLPLIPRPTADRILARLQQLRRLVAPRVSAAVLSTIWNRWPTARRLQRVAPCVFRCSHTAQDSIEHYACCPVVHAAALRDLRLAPCQWPHALPTFLLCARGEGHSSPSNLTRRALLLYACYRATNHLRHNPQPALIADASQLLRHMIWAGVKGHEASERVIDGLHHL